MSKDRDPKELEPVWNAVDACGETLAPLPHPLQGATLAVLLATWLLEYDDPKVRAEMLNMHMTETRDMCKTLSEMRAEEQDLLR